MPKPVQSVRYNDGEDILFALVKKDNGDNNLDLIVFHKTGPPGFVLGVPKRDPADYGSEGGGVTMRVIG